jgi:3-dehydrosphinganine reductase
MELKPFNIVVSVCYPPDTDTPGYEIEMQAKPALTKKLSESGSLFKPSAVAKDIVTYSRRGYFGISTGLDGWLLKQLHPGMSPVNCVFETLQPIIFSPFARIISIFYIKVWDFECYADSKTKLKSS